MAERYYADYEGCEEWTVRDSNLPDDTFDSQGEAEEFAARLNADERGREKWRELLEALKRIRVRELRLVAYLAPNTPEMKTVEEIGDIVDKAIAGVEGE